MYSSSKKPGYGNGVALQKEGQFEQAAQVFMKIKDSDPKFKESRERAYECYLVLATHEAEQAEAGKGDGHYSECERHYQAAERCKPLDFAAYQKRARVRKKRYQSLHEDEKVPAENAAFVNYLVFEGGGVKGIAYLGAMEEAIATGLIDPSALKALVGTSAGAIIATLLGVGYDVAALQKILKEANFTEFMDGPYRDTLLDLLRRREEVAGQVKNRVGNVKKAKSSSSAATVGLSELASLSSHQDFKAIKEGFSLLQGENMGLFPGDFFREHWLENLLQQKTGIGWLTFKELHELVEQQPHTYRDIYLVGANISTRQSEVFSWEHTPDVIISDAVRISMSIPLVFQPHQLYYKQDEQRVCAPSGHVYVDGGILDNYLLTQFDQAKYILGSTLPAEARVVNPHTLGFRLVSERTKRSYQDEKEVVAYPPPKQFGEFLWQVVMTAWHKQESDFHRNVDQRTVFIEDQGVETTEFDLSLQRQELLIAGGREAVKSYLADHAHHQADAEQAVPLESRPNLLPLFTASQARENENQTAVSGSSPNVSQDDVKGQKPSSY